MIDRAGELRRLLDADGRLDVDSRLDMESPRSKDSLQLVQAVSATPPSTLLPLISLISSL